MQDFRKLKVWRKSHKLTLKIYSATATFPKEELYGLMGQIRRAVSSVPANIAEACGRGGNAEFVRFIRIAMGSASELKYYLLLARDLKLLQGDEHERLTGEIIEVKCMLTAFAQRLRAMSSQKLKTKN